MRACRVTPVAVLCILAAACATLRPPPHAASNRNPVRPASPGGVATAAGNRAAAQAEAARLLSLAQVPAGAVRLARPPSLLAGPALGQPEGVSSLVDQAMTWQVGLPFPAARAWLSAHPPRGLPEEGSGQAWDRNGVTMAGYGYRGPASRAWQSASLQIGIAAAGPRSSVFRADAVIVWLDPRPVPSGPGPHPMRVTVAGGCPPGDAGVTGVTNPGAGLSQRLLPTGPPTAGLSCRYDGLNGRPWQLAAGQRLSTSAARQAAASMARLPLSHIDGGVMSCPADDGSAEVLALAYPGRPDVDLWVTLNGCGGVSNGYITAGGP
jgi:hypothetical protein